MGLFEEIADRRIAEARAAGLFDNLPGAGKPIPDLDRERPPGWWAARVAKRERSIDRARLLDHELRKGRAALWRLETEHEVRASLAELNRLVDDYNRTTTWERRQPVDEASTLRQWRRFTRRSAG
ncbi:MAG: DnaJ family domain-containing protein [Actinomycetota bacterium]